MDTAASIVKRAIPEGILHAFISEYVFRIVTIPKGLSLVKSMPLRVAASIDFFLGDSYQTINYRTQRAESFVRCTIRGPRTHKKCRITLSGHFISFTIKFKPAGLYRLLGIPAYVFCNQSIDGRLVHAGFFAEITERLMGCSNINECIQVAEPCLLRWAFRQHKPIYPSKAIDQMTAMILDHQAPANLTALFRETCLSERQLQRNFLKEIGTTPKLYSNMVRFEQLLRYKTKLPEKSWTDLAYEFNYYDQMHLIKHFQRFLAINPGDFIPEDFAF